MKNKFKDFELVEHTADIGLKIYGKDEKDLFINAARGMFFLITGSRISLAPESIRKYYALESEAPGREDLLVTWLNDLLYIHFTDLVIFDDYIIDYISEEVIKSKVRAVEIKDSPYQIVKEIKAVTYHNLQVCQNKNGIWEANIVFDI
ncbi:MAG TPA: archease [Atribacterota bacterium]|nr:archease [Atribacterota bacterium]